MSRALRTEVMTAFSRDQEEKIYVQDVIRKEGKRLLQLILKGAVVFVCGSSGNMPRQVREAFVEAITEYEDNGKRRGYEEADKVMTMIEKRGFYVQETW